MPAAILWRPWWRVRSKPRTSRPSLVRMNYTPMKNVKLSAEVRQDKSDTAIFAKLDGTPTTKQSSLELMAVYSF